MERNEIIEIIRDVLVTVLKHEKFEMHDELSVADVDGWDSLSHMIIINEIESRFKMRFKLKELNKLRSMGTLIDLVENKLEEQSNN